MGALPGIVRDAVADLVGELGLSWRPGAYEPQDLYAADEAFLTNALIGVVPLVCGRPAHRQRRAGSADARAKRPLRAAAEREAKLLDAWLPWRGRIPPLNQRFHNFSESSHYSHGKVLSG